MALNAGGLRPLLNNQTVIFFRIFIYYFILFIHGRNTHTFRENSPPSLRCNTNRRSSIDPIQLSFLLLAVDYILLGGKLESTLWLEGMRQLGNVKCSALNICRLRRGHLHHHPAGTWEPKRNLFFHVRKIFLCRIVESNLTVCIFVYMWLKYSGWFKNVNYLLDG